MNASLGKITSPNATCRSGLYRRQPQLLYKGLAAQEESRVLNPANIQSTDAILSTKLISDKRNRKNSIKVRVFQ